MCEAMEVQRQEVGKCAEAWEDLEAGAEGQCCAGSFTVTAKRFRQCDRYYGNKANVKVEVYTGKWQVCISVAKERHRIKCCSEQSM